MPPGAVDSWGPDVALYAERVLRIKLDLWARRALNRALAVDADWRLVHGLYLISTGRQNGKTVIARSILGWALTAGRMPDWRRLLGLAYDKGQARVPYEAVMEDLAPLARRYGRAERGGLTVTRYLGIRSGMYGRHREYHVGSREAADQVRSQSNDLGVFDEIRTQRDHRVWAALEPTTTARPDPIILAISTAGDDRSILLREWWERGRRIIDGAEPPGRFGMTWYAAQDDQAPDDPKAWKAANPAVAEGRIAIARLRESYLEHQDRPLVFRQERLNLWTDAMDEWLPPGVWARQEGAQPPTEGRIILGVEVVRTWRRASVVVAIPTAEGAWVGMAGSIDVAQLSADHGPSVSPDELVSLIDGVAQLWRPAAVAYSTAAAAAPHVEAWASRNDVETIKLGSRELRAASQLFRSELIGGRLHHSVDPLMAYQVRQARPSAPIEAGDWYLSMKESAGEIDAVRAAAWAAWAAIAPPPTPVPFNIHV